MRRSRRRWAGVVLAATVAGGVLVAGPAEAFAPNNLWSMGDQNHQSITEQAFTELADEFFSTKRPTRGMRDAVKEVVEADAEVDGDQRSSRLHFDGENFELGQIRLQQLADSVVLRLERDQASGARSSLGHALHSVQDFYSHTNWVELGNTEPNPDLGRAGRTLGPVAGPTEPTCQDSQLITSKLTSGYYSGEDRQPQIEGKCRHGGPLDFGAGEGGISKDFSSQSWSPHFYDHLRAARLARLGTAQFIRDIKARVTDAQMRKLFGLGPTLAMAIDTTGSMGGIIQSVKEQVTQLVDGRIGTPEEPSEYVLVPFNDPEVGPVTTTDDPEEFKQAVDQLSAWEGGDCPEVSMAALSMAVQLSPEGSEVFLFTDADAKDADLRYETMLRAQSKDIHISPMIFGGCDSAVASKASGDKQPSTSSAKDEKDPGQVQSAPTAKGVTTAATVADSTYQTVAAGTGGRMLEADRGSVADVMKLVDSATRVDASALLNTGVTLADTPTVLTVPVDSTMRKVDFSVNGPRGETQTTTVTRPNGSVVTPDDEGVESIPLGGTSVPATYLVVDRPVAGEWKLTIEGTGKASVRVSADSDLDLDTFEFISPDAVDPEPRRDHPGPVSQDPPPGPVAVHARLTADVRSAEFEFRDADGTVRGTFTLPRRGDEFVGLTTLPEGRPAVYVRGEDSTGAAFQRTINSVAPQSNPKLLVSPPAADPLLPGTVPQRSVSVTNLGPAGTFQVEQTSDWEFVSTFRRSLTLDTGETGSASFDIFVPESAVPGTELTMTYLVREDGKPENTSMARQVVPILSHVSESTTPGGASVRPQITAVDQNAAVRFPGQAGQRVSIELRDGNIPGNVSAFLRDPAGSFLVEHTQCAAGCYFEPVTLPRDGTYTLLVDPVGAGVGAVTVQVYDVADVTATVTPGGPARAVSTVPGQNAVFSFAGDVGERVNVVLSNGTLAQDQATATLFRPDWLQVDEQACGVGCTFAKVAIDLPGAYRIVYDVAGARTATIAAKVEPTLSDAVVTTTPGGGSVRVATTETEQNARVTFPGRAGQRVSIEVSESTFGSALPLSLRGPDRAVLAAKQQCYQSCFFEPVTLPADGTYTFLIDPYRDAIGALTVQVYDAPVIPTVPTTLDGAATTLTTAVPGQNASVSFTAEAGQRVSVLATGKTYSGFPAVYFQLPNGTTVAAGGGFDGSGGGGFFGPVTLPSAGVWTLWVDPEYARTGSVTLQLYDVPPDVSARVDPGSAAVTVRTVAPGQNASLTFAGRVGQRVSLLLTDGNYPGSAVDVFNPDGSALYYANGCSTSCVIELPVLTAAGDYRVGFHPERTVLGLTVQAFDVTADARGTVVVGGPAVTVDTGPGQNAVVSFAGTAGRKVTVVASLPSYDYSIGSGVLSDPAGAALSSIVPCGRTCVFAAVTLPATGTYTLALDTAGGFAGPITVQAYDVTADVSVTATAGGAAVVVATPTPGQNAVVPFTATAGQRISVALSAGSYNGLVTATLLRPDGTTVATNLNCTSSCFFEPTATAAAGSYKLLLDPQDAAVGTVSVRVYVVPADAAATTTVGSTGVTVTTTVPGQNAVVSFTGTANRVVTVAVSAATFTGTTTYTVRKPDGTTLATKTASGASTSFANLTLPVAGTYTVLLDPSSTAVGSARVRPT